MTIIDQLSDFVYKTDFDDIPDETVLYTKHLATKIVSAMLLGAVTAAGKRTIQYMESLGGREDVSVIGSKLRCPLEDATFINGVTCHAAELEDDQFPSATSDITIFPVIFPLAEKLDLTGKKFIEASALGMEIMNRVGMFTLSGKGFTDLPFYGVIGAAVTAGKALDLNRDQLSHAIGIAIGRAGGFIVNFGTDAHYVESAGACRDGLVAAQLARVGMTGNPDIERWLGDLFSDSKVDLDQIVSELGNSPWRVHKIWVKKYPCCFLTHRHIDMMLDILSENDISAHDIESINIHVGPVDYTCNRPEPTDTEDARFSFQHIMAALMLEGEVDSRHFTEGVLREPRFRDVWKKTSVTNHPEWPTEFMSGVARIEIILTDGQKVTKEKTQAKGGPDAPLSEDEFHSLYEKYTRDVLSKEATDKTWNFLSQLEKLDSVDELLESLSKEGPTGG